MLLSLMKAVTYNSVLTVSEAKPFTRGKNEREKKKLFWLDLQGYTQCACQSPQPTTIHFQEKLQGRMLSDSSA